MPGIVYGVFKRPLSDFVVQAPTQPADRTQHPDGNAPGYFMEVNAYGRNKAEQLSGKGAGTGTEAQGRPVHRLP